MQRRVPARIPKAARIAAADALASTIDAAIGNPDAKTWERFFLFAPLALGLHTTNQRASLAKAAKSNIDSFMLVQNWSCDETCVASCPTKPLRKFDLRKQVNAKLSQGDVSAAVRLVASDDTVLEPTADVLAALRLKHPASPSDNKSPPVPDSSIATTLSEEDVRQALKSFRPSSSGGVDGLRPGHLKDLTAGTTAEAGRRLLSSLTRLCNCITRGELPHHARDLLFASNLTALRKKDGGIRPIAVGNTIRRLAAKAACRPTIRSLSREFAPTQLGVGVPGGCEAAAHAVRSLVNDVSRVCGAGEGRILVKLDMQNAFNSIRRDHLLEVCHRRAPSIYPLVHSAYADHSLLFASGEFINSEAGVQQGDPLGPLLFSLGVDDIARSVSAPVNIWYLDDATIGGTPEIVLNALKRIIPSLAAVGLIVNPAKSELLNIDCNTSDFEAAVSSIHGVLDGALVTDRDDLVILGSPILQRAIETDLKSKTETLEKLTNRLRTIDAHPALFLLRNCFAIPKLLFGLRSAPCFRSSEDLLELDSIIRSCTEDICNVPFDETGWRQATLPISLGGLGLRCPSDVALPAYCSSVHANRSLVEEILTNSLESPLDNSIVTVGSEWRAQGLDYPTDPKKQKSWDSVRSRKAANSLKLECDQHRLACFSAAAQPHSGAWLSAIPSPAIGTLMDDECVRYAVALRTGARVCEQHRCRCGAVIDEFGLHPLACSKSAGRFPRHSALNDILKRALDAAGFHSILEPVGLDRGDGKRPDGMTVFPFSSGKPLVWDATCSDTFAPSVLAKSAADPGYAARAAEERKTSKYGDLTSRYAFTPIAVETSGVFGPKSSAFLEKLGSLLSRRTGEPREPAWLFERLSIAVARGNAHCLAAASSQSCDT